MKKCRIKQYLNMPTINTRCKFANKSYKNKCYANAWRKANDHIQIATDIAQWCRLFELELIVTPRYLPKNSNLQHLAAAPPSQNIWGGVGGCLPAGPPKYAHLSPEGVSGQNFHDFRIFTGSDFELSRSDFEYAWAQLLESMFTCEKTEFSII